MHGISVKSKDGRVENGGMTMTEELIIPVKGMGCNACVKKIETAVGAMPGVTGVKADLATAEARVRLDGSGSTADQVVEKIREIGFDAELPGHGKKGLFGKLRK